MRREGAVLQRYEPFGSLMPGRNYSSSSYRFGFQGQVKDDEVYGATGTAMTAEFWEYDSRTARRWNLDPKQDESFSPYATFSFNPILYSDPDGDSVKFGGFRDKVNSFFAKTFNKDYRHNFKNWKSSPDMYNISRDATADVRLVDANPMQLPNVGANNAFDVRYSSGFGLQDVSNPGLRDGLTIGAIPFSIGKLAIGSLMGVGIGFHNIFSSNDIGWGMANRLSFHNGANELSWGFGDYNRYNMFGQPLEKSPFGAAKIHPRDGFFGLRAGVGRLMPANFIDVLGRIRINQSYYHLHINLMDDSKARRRSKLGDAEHTIDFKTNTGR